MTYDKEFETFWKTFNPSFGVEKHDAYEIWKSSAEQARKEAAERAVAFLKKEWYWFNDDTCYADELREAILGDSVAVSTDTEKLAIAVKALIALYGWIKAEVENFGATCPDDFIIDMVEIALKEIQG